VSGAIQSYSFVVNFHIFDDIIRESGAFSAPIWIIFISRMQSGLLVGARVTSLQEVPQFIIFSVAEGFQGSQRRQKRSPSMTRIFFAFGPSIGASGGFITIWKGAHFDAEIIEKNLLLDSNVRLNDSRMES
ncbi:hypothetical protein ACJX0J_020315, partial [Zea mays]